MKTGHNQDIPIADPLQRHLSKNSRRQTGCTALPFPVREETKLAIGAVYNVMVKAGIVPKRSTGNLGIALCCGQPEFFPHLLPIGLFLQIVEPLFSLVRHTGRVELNLRTDREEKGIRHHGCGSSGGRSK